MPNCSPIFVLKVLQDFYHQQYLCQAFKSLRAASTFEALMYTEFDVSTTKGACLWVLL